MLEPSQVIQYLGNIINTTDMTVTLPLEKKICIEDTCRKIKEEEFISVRSLASLIGLLVSSFGPLHYRLLEKEKVRSLKMHKGNFDGLMRVSKNIKEELNCWISNIMSQNRIINRGNPEMTITTDTSNDGWGAVKEDVNIGGRLKDYKKIHHINDL